MSVLVSLAAVAALVAIAWIGAGVAGLKVLFGIVIPYAAIATFLLGFIYRIMKWAKSPVPFNITTSCGQQKSLPWIESSSFEAPHNVFGVIARMALEVLGFRSLMRNVKSEFVSRKDFEPRLAYKSSLWLWMGALAFHYSFLCVFVRHYRFFSNPQPFFVNILETLDGFFQLGSPTVFISGFVLLGALGFLFLRRIVNPQLRYISIVPDYFPLFLLMGVAGSGILMRYTSMRVDIVGVKNLCMGLMSFHPTIPDAGVGPIFYIHLLLVSSLFAYFPFSKLMHMGGVFLSPTRNMISASRMKRHVNPWNYPVKVHTYEEYEDDFRDRMVAAGIPVDKEPAK
jgi:nitrate reductase gamma subunit